jgi:DNA-binding response OmpR family regulator
MPNDADIMRELRQLVADLQEELRQLREDTVYVDSTFAGILTKQHAALLMGIYKRDIAPFAYLDNITEEHGKYNRYEGERHQTLRTKVAVWKMRRKLKPYGIEIKTWKGVGYYLDDENKAKLKQLMEKKDG